MKIYTFLEPLVWGVELEEARKVPGSGDGYDWEDKHLAREAGQPAVKPVIQTDVTSLKA